VTSRRLSTPILPQRGVINGARVKERIGSFSSHRRTIFMAKRTIRIDGYLSSEQVSKGDNADHLMPSTDDLEFEEEVLRSGTLPRVWLAYLDAKKDAPAKRRYLIYERAVKMLPGSYKVCPSHARRRIYLLYPRFHLKNVWLSLRFPIPSRQLWYAYLRERHGAVRGLCVMDPAFVALNNTFERALVTMHKMPRLWELYLSFLVGQRFVTKVRRTCDRALASLPITQHERIWAIYLVGL